MNINNKRDRYILPIIEWARSNDMPQHLELAVPGDHVKKSKVERRFKVPSNFTGKDYITMLLHIDAEIEHGLMLQYLFSAYTIDASEVAEKYREKVTHWQSIILGIAKEEMGHFISVQNVLKLIGAPLNLGRESYPWDTPFYPFPFTLERFTLDSLAKYVYAEAPQKWLESEDETARKIKKSVTQDVNDPHTVGALFKVLLQLIKDPKVIPDDVFEQNTYPYQAKFEEWGRGYTNGARGKDTINYFKDSPDVLVAPLLSRDDAYNALDQIAEQGEGEDIPGQGDGTSHFEKFLYIYQQFSDILEEDDQFIPSRPVVTNPFTGVAAIGNQATTPEEESGKTNEIKNPVGILWADLFDLRYRLLLNFLNHSFLLDNGSTNNIHSARGLIINSTFGEMYNLRSISNILVRIPISENTLEMCGPPFTLPYSFDLPFGENNRWKQHRDILSAANNIVGELLQVSDQPYQLYLTSLQSTDNKLMQMIDQLTEADFV